MQVSYKGCDVAVYTLGLVDCMRLLPSKVDGLCQLEMLGGLWGAWERLLQIMVWPHQVLVHEDPWNVHSEPASLHAPMSQVPNKSMGSWKLRLAETQLPFNRGYILQNVL